MRTAPFVVATLAFGGAAGCGEAPDPCRGNKDVCIAVRVAGNVTGLDQLAVTLDQPARTTRFTPEPPTKFSLPVDVAIIPVATARGASARLAVDGMAAGRSLARTEISIKIPSAGSLRVTVELKPGTQSDASVGADASLPGSGDALFDSGDDDAGPSDAGLQ